MTGLSKARRIKMGRAKQVRTAKGIAVSVLAHVVICALLGFAAIHIKRDALPEPVYDVALVGAPGKPAAAPAPVAPPTPSAPVEQQAKPPEEVVPPEPDDIIEEKKPEEQPVQEQPPAPVQPQPEAPPQSASAETGGTSAEGTASEATGAAEGSPNGSGETQGIPPASNAIEAPAVPPSITASRAPEYPYSAQRKGIEGTVVIRFLLGKDGSVDDVDVAESSGNDALDRAALEAAEGFGFSPGLDSYGRPVRCYAYQPFTFRLE